MFVEHAEVVVDAVNAGRLHFLWVHVAFKILYAEVWKQLTESLAYMEAEGYEHHSLRIKKSVFFKALDSQSHESVFYLWA